MRNEQADSMESTVPTERAEGPESTVLKERAVRRESTMLTERAESQESTVRNEHRRRWRNEAWGYLDEMRAEYVERTGVRERAAPGESTVDEEPYPARAPRRRSEPTWMSAPWDPSKP